MRLVDSVEMVDFASQNLIKKLKKNPIKTFYFFLLLQKEESSNPYKTLIYQIKVERWIRRIQIVRHCEILRKWRKRYICKSGKAIWAQIFATKQKAICLLQSADFVANL